MYCQGFQGATLQTFIANDAFCFWIQVKIAPETLSEDTFLHAQLLCINGRKLIDAEGPSVDGRGKDDIALRRVKVNMRVVLCFDMPIREGVLESCRRRFVTLLLLLSLIWYFNRDQNNVLFSLPSAER